MPNEADSRDTTPTLRWGETDLEVPSVNVSAPSGGLKDTGWIPGVSVPVAEWMNWQVWSAGVFNRYLENMFELQWTRNCVLAGAAAGECAVTAGAGLSVNVATGRVWIEGQFFSVPAATNLALGAAHATLDRRDLITARVTALVPNYFVVAGTPGLLAAAPSLPAGHVRLAEVLVEATSVAPDEIVDVREFGAVDLDRVNATRRLNVGFNGSLGAGESVFQATDNLVPGQGGLVRIGEAADPLLEIATLAGFEHIQVKPELVRFDAPILRRYDIDATEFQAVVIGFVPETFHNSNGNLFLDNAQNVMAGVRIPKGCTIKAVRIYGTRGITTNGIFFQLVEVDKNTGTQTDLIAVPPTNVGDAIGDYVLAEEGMSVVVSHGKTYRLVLEGDGSGAPLVQVWAAEVEYEELRPWDGI